MFGVRYGSRGNAVTSRGLVTVAPRGWRVWAGVAKMIRRSYLRLRVFSRRLFRAARGSGRVLCEPPGPSHLDVRCQRE
eukprot:11188763-Lingulodinium_polyedra.AAC.1